MKRSLQMWAGAAVVALALAPSLTLAANPFTEAQNLTNKVGQSAELGQPKSITDIAGQLINILLGFLGIVLLGYLLYAGYLWMTAGGDPGNVKKATDMIKQAIIGLVIIVAAFAISSFVLGSLVNATTG